MPGNATVHESNANIHGRYSMPREVHRRLSVEAAKQERGIQDLMAEILDQHLPHIKD